MRQTGDSGGKTGHIEVAEGTSKLEGWHKALAYNLYNFIK